jgi:hypothetical protein
MRSRLRPGRALIAVVLAVTLVGLPAAATAADDDVRPPDVLLVTAPATMVAGIGPSIVTVEFDESQIWAAQIFIVDPQGREEAFALDPATTPSGARFTFDLQASVLLSGPPGTWAISAIQAADREGNMARWERAQLEVRGFRMTIELAPSGVPADTSRYPPVLAEPAGYYLLTADARVFGFGDDICTEPVVGVRGDVVDIEGRPTIGNPGYRVTTDEGWFIDSCGYRDTYSSIGNAEALRAGERIIDHAATVSSQIEGELYFTDRGRAFAFGARWWGDMGSVPLNQPVISAVATPSAGGYYMVAADGGVFAFGDAVFRGSMGGTRLNAPVVGLTPDPDGEGYWLVASDGGVFAFDAPFRGSLGAIRLNAPVVGMVPYGDGYLLVASDGGVFNFSNLPFEGSLGANPPSSPVIDIAVAYG